MAPQRPPNFWDLLRKPARYEKQQPNFAWWWNNSGRKFLPTTALAPLTKHFCNTNTDTRSVCGSYQSSQVIKCYIRCTTLCCFLLSIFILSTCCLSRAFWQEIQLTVAFTGDVELQQTAWQTAWLSIYTVNTCVFFIFCLSILSFGWVCFSASAYSFWEALSDSHWFMFLFLC